MSGEDNSSIVPINTPGDRLIDVGAFAVSAIPYVGGPISNVLSGISQGRRMRRVVDFLGELDRRLRTVEAAADSEYLKSDEFEELLEQTLHRVAAERHAAKRAIYQVLLTDMVKSPKIGYDEQLAFIRIIEQLQPDHIRVLEAMSQPPNDVGNISISSPINFLRERLTGMSTESISARASELNDFRIINNSSLGTMMTGGGAADMRGRITPMGKRFIAYLEEANENDL